MLRGHGLDSQAVPDGTMLLVDMRATSSVDVSTAFIAGVIHASCTWFTGLATVTFYFKKALKGRLRRWINILCGAVIVLYGLNLGYGFVQLIMHC